MSWKEGLEIFRIDSKEYENRKKSSSRIRKDVQEYPNKPLKEAFMDKLKGESEDETIV